MSTTIEERMRRFLPKTARWAYFQSGNGPMFVYNTEPLRLTNPSDPAEGKYESLVCVPYGPGSRSGKATRWKPDESTRFAHVLRRDAKARAIRLFEEWEATA